jgi:hypothetical protein
MWSTVKFPGELGQGERACHTAWMGLMAHSKLSMFEAKASHSTGQNEEVHRRTIALCSQLDFQ